jgi:hypothetical protein
MFGWIFDRLPWWLYTALGVGVLALAVLSFQQESADAAKARAALAAPAPAPIELASLSALPDTASFDLALRVFVSAESWNLHVTRRKKSDLRGAALALFADPAAQAAGQAAGMALFDTKSDLDAWRQSAEPDPDRPGGLILRGIRGGAVGLVKAGRDGFRDKGLSLTADFTSLQPYTEPREAALARIAGGSHIASIIIAALGLALVGFGFLRRRA